MNKNLERNEECIVGLPSCGYVFNSTISCFIAYGFDSSNLEMELLSGILKENNIEVYEAGGNIEPGKNAFCTKICSKIITSQFCIVLLNNDIKEKVEMPNANVNMEYGLMLGYNKYVIPFQKVNSKLPFNVSGLDTIKYTTSNFKVKAEKAIKQAIIETKPTTIDTAPPNQIIELFLLSKNMFIDPLIDAGTKNIFNLGSPLGFNLLVDFTGFSYIYLGIFGHLNLNVIKWKMKKLEQALLARFGNIGERIKFKILDPQTAVTSLELLKKMEIWIIVQNDSSKSALVEFANNLQFKIQVFSNSEIEQQVNNLKLE